MYTVAVLSRCWKPGPFIVKLAYGFEIDTCQLCAEHLAGQLTIDGKGISEER